MIYIIVTRDNRVCGAYNCFTSDEYEETCDEIESMGFKFVDAVFIKDPIDEPIVMTLLYEKVKE